MPISPLLRTASAQAVQNQSGRASAAAKIAAARKKLTPMSSVLTWPSTMYSGLEASTAAAYAPVGAPNSRLPTRKVRTMPAKPRRALHRRATQSRSPSSSNKAAGAPDFSGGLLEEFKPVKGGG